MRTLLTLLMFATLAACAAENPATDRWGPVRFLLGNWEGTATGEPGKGSVQRTYVVISPDEFVEYSRVHFLRKK